MARAYLILAAALAAMAANAAAEAADPLAEMNACRGLGDAARLACFDRVLARHDAPAPVTAAAPIVAAPVATAPAPVTPAPVAPAPPPAPQASADFGSERLPASAAAPQKAASIVAKVKAVSWNAFKHFTVTLEDGQVWRQLDSDTTTARFGAADAVKISRGFLDSYSLSIEGVWGTYKVKRIK